MIRPAARFAAALTMITMLTAAGARAQAAGPFPEVPLSTSETRTHRLAWICIGAGLGLLGGSTVLAERANDRYEEYRNATDPRRVEDLYDETIALDRLSATALLSGEVLVATGLYLRFLRRPPTARVALDVGPARCAVLLRF